jgi:hypothetical protein
MSFYSHVKMICILTSTSLCTAPISYHDSIQKLLFIILYFISSSSSRFLEKEKYAVAHNKNIKKDFFLSFHSWLLKGNHKPAAEAATEAVE